MKNIKEIPYSQLVGVLYADSITTHVYKSSPVNILFYIPDRVSLISSIAYKINLSPFERSVPKFSLLINDAVVANFCGTDTEIDLMQYLADIDGIIPRNTWLSIGVQPNSSAKVEISYKIKGFAQSKSA